MSNILGIIGAMDEEIAIYKQNMTGLNEAIHNGFNFYQGKLNRMDVVLVKSGVGKVFASMVTQSLIDKYSVDYVIFTGVAGSLNSKLNIGDVVIGKDSVQHDFNATALGFKLGQISYTNFRFFKADKKLLKAAVNCKMDYKSMVGRILTGDQFITQSEKQSMKYLVNDLKGDCIEMEGAAVAQVCIFNKIPHIVVRTMSDNSDGTAAKDYNRFKQIVAGNSYKLVKSIVDEIR